MTDLDEAPDYAEPLLAWRAWRVVRARGGLELGSIVQKTLWPPGKALSAVCLRRPTIARWLRRTPPHQAPRTRCECGIYGTSLDQITSYLTEMPLSGVGRVFGRVSLWGTVIECERGFRASIAYPAHIYVPADAAGDEDDWAELAYGLQHYGVPVEAISERCRDAPRAVAAWLAA